jgi:hypothetical protein
LPAAPLEDPRLAELVDRVHVVGVGTRARLLERETMLRLRMWATPEAAWICRMALLNCE